MLIDLIKPTQGSIFLFGKPIATLGKDLFRHLSVTIEYPGFYPNLTANENLLNNAKVFNVPISRIDEVLELMGLQQAKHQVIHSFSLGMKRRLALARALLHRPSILILDEPTNGLDPAGIKIIRETIKQLAENHHMTIFVSSHILSEIELMASRI